MKARTVAGLGTLLLLVACRLPTANLQDASNSTTAASSDPPLFVEAPPDTELDPAGDPPVPSLTKGECAPEVADYPEVYFGTRLLIRLPKPVTYTDLVEVSPDRAQLVAPASLPTCRKDRPSVVLERMILELRDPDPGDQLELLRNAVLDAHGLLDQATLIEAEVDSQARRGQWVFERQNTRLLVAMFSNGRELAIVVYEAAAADWSLVVNTLRDSARKISLLKP
jgi:hypothetical protein